MFSGGLFMDLLNLSKSIVEKRISPREVVSKSLEVIKDKNPIYNAFITVCDEKAMEAASIAEAEIMNGKVRSVFHGMPIAIKDLIFTKGIRTTMGSKIFENHVPVYDAAVINKLENAGAIIIGKANTQEFAYGPTGDKSFFGACRNPYNPSKISGGSSSGPGAAIAAGMVHISIGTDTGGSIRIPSSACGVVGMKPTFGIVSKYGVYNLAYTLDHIGPMTRNVKENALLLNIIAGFDNKDSFSIQGDDKDYTSLMEEEISGKVIGLPSFYFQQVDTEILQALHKVIDIYETLGAQVKEVEIPWIEEISANQVITLQSEAFAVHEKNIEFRGADFNPEVFGLLQASREARGYEYVIAQQKRSSLISNYNKIFEEVDVLLTPTMPILPTDINQREVIIGDREEQVRHALLRFTSPTNYTGNPSLSVPCGFSKCGLPIGFQLIGKHNEEAKVYQFGYAYEQYNLL